MTIVYIVIGIPISRFADTSSRVIPLAFGLLVWTGMVCMTAFAETYWMLLLAQMVIGIGEVSGYCRKWKRIVYAECQG